VGTPLLPAYPTIRSSFFMTRSPAQWRWAGTAWDSKLVPVSWERHGGLLQMRVDQSGKPLLLAVSVDGEAFGSEWLSRVARLSKR
jgi:hypothetical protein